MKRQQTMAAVLLAVFLVLALVVVAVRSQPEESKPAAQRIWDLTLGAVAALTARGSEGVSYTMRKDTLGTWSMVEPPLGPADQNRLNWLTEDLAHLETVRRFSPGQVEPAEAGLDAPTFCAPTT